MLGYALILILHRLVCSTFFFFSSRRRHTRLQGDWSSDVCSSDLSWTPSIRTSTHGSDSTDGRREPHRDRAPAVPAEPCRPGGRRPRRDVPRADGAGAAFSAL